MSGDAASWAHDRVARVRDDPDARLELAARTYDGPYGHAPRHLPFRRAALSFMRWQRRRGVLDPGSGSPWWRACNERLLRDGCESVARSGGSPGPSSAPSVDRWLEFIARPRAETWYAAHNASIVASYLDHADLAAREPGPERFFLNVVLFRVLYAHALTSAPRLALGWLAPAGRLLGDPRLGAVGMFLALGRVVPLHYPPHRELEYYLRVEHRLAELLDHGIVVPRLAPLYRWSAAELGEPRLVDLLDAAGHPSYAWSDRDPDVWGSPPRRERTVRLVRTVLPVRPT